MNWKKKIITCTFFIAMSSLIMLLTNKLFNFLATIDNLLSDVDGNYYKWHFGKIYYTKKGSGSPLLLIHDLTSYSSSYEWNKTINELSKKNTVYTLDLLGCGRSDKPILTYTNFLYVQLLTDFIKNIILDKTDIIVSGESSPFVVMACKNDNSIINRIVMINPLDLGYLALIPNKKTKTLKSLLYLPIIGTIIYNIQSSKTAVENLFIGDYFYDPLKIDEQYIKAYHESAHLGKSKSKYLLASIKGRYTNANIIQCLQSLNNSVFIIVGDGIPNNFTIAEQYLYFLPSIEIMTIDKTKQLPHIEDPNKFIEQIRLMLDLY